MDGSQFGGSSGSGSGNCNKYKKCQTKLIIYQFEEEEKIPVNEVQI